MAVPYPPDGPVNYSQNKAHQVSVATRVIEAALDELRAGTPFPGNLQVGCD